MMQEKIGRELARFGRAMPLYTKQHPEGVAVKAMFQPVRDRGTAKAVPTPLGWQVQDRFVYIGPAQASLEEGECRLEVDGVRYRMRTAQPVYAGGQLSHWWAMFDRKEREVR